MSGEAPAKRDECDVHHWVSTHQPGLPIYWVDQCSLCGDYNGKRMLEGILKAGFAPPPAATPPPEPAGEQAPRQRKGHNPYLPGAPVRKPFTNEGVADALDNWAALEREHETWRDGDTNTYRYRANLLEAAAVRLRDPSTPAPGVSGETREAVQVAAVRALAMEWVGHEGAHESAYVRNCGNAVMAALAPDTACTCEGAIDPWPGHADSCSQSLTPGPDTARDGETRDRIAVLIASYMRSPRRAWEAADAVLATLVRDGEHDHRFCAIDRGAAHQYRDMYRAARRELDDLKAAVERLCDDAFPGPDDDGGEPVVYEAHLRALLTPPDTGRDTE